jgi:hypothetical protein
MKKGKKREKRIQKFKLKKFTKTNRSHAGKKEEMQKGRKVRYECKMKETKNNIKEKIEKKLRRKTIDKRIKKRIKRSTKIRKSRKKYKLYFL